jgi:mannose-6-phosphate isomerase-like protein (cupin superfamily)
VQELKKNNDETTQIRKTVFRPWGFYTCLNGGEGWLTKIISVSPEHKLSLQSHNHRSEHWVVLEGVATVILDEETHTLNKGQSIDIPLKAKHSLQNHTKEPLKILEVQKGDYISEDDIIRYEDMYGRIK